MLKTPNQWRHYTTPEQRSAIDSSYLAQEHKQAYTNSVAKTHRHNTIQTELSRPRTRPYAPNGLDGGSLLGFFPDVANRRTRMPVRRTSPSTRHGETTERGRSFRRRRPRRSGWLSSRFTNDSVVTSPQQADGPGSGSSRGPIGTHSRCCLQRRPRRQPTYPGSRLVRRTDAAPCVLLATVPAGAAVPSKQRLQHSRCEATLCLTESRRLSAITQRTLSSLTQLDFSHGCRTLLNMDSNQLSSLAKFSRKPTKHTLFM